MMPETKNNPSATFTTFRALLRIAWIGVVGALVFILGKQRVNQLHQEREARREAEAALALAHAQLQDLSQELAQAQTTTSQETFAYARRQQQLTLARTQIQKLQEELKLTHAVADEANRLRTQFLANMSHELRTPLNAIISFTDFIGKDRYGPLTDRQRDLQQRIMSNAQHLLGLINDILDLSKLNTGQLELSREQVDLRPLLRGVMSSAIGLTKDKGIDLALTIPDTLPSVWVDPARIRQLLLNLLSNAAKFTQQGRITVRITPHDEHFLCIAVQDTGIGIAAEHHALIFDEFRQIDGELTRPYEGTGLGLPICKRIAELHGGRIWLESEMGAGTTFFFTVPIYQHMVAAPPNESPPLPHVNRLGVQKTKILLVEDDPDTREIIRTALEDDYELIEALDGAQALEILRVQHPDLLILDLILPQLDGFAFLGELRRMPEYRDVPVVVLTAKDLNSHERTWLNERVQVSLEKNQFLYGEFGAYIQHLIGKGQNHDH